MGKKIGDEWVFIAPEIRARKENGIPIVEDLRTNTRLRVNNIEDKIKIYERQVKEWFLKKASYSMRGKNYGFIGLMVCLSYLEGVQQYREGETSEENLRRYQRNRDNRGNTENELFGSKGFFVKSLIRIYGNEYTIPNLKLFYKQARCGLFHDGMTKDMIRYRYDYPQALDFSVEGLIMVNPKILLKDIKKDFNKYLKELRTVTNTELRTNFYNMYTHKLL